MRIQNKRRQVFSLTAPEANEVLLAGDFTEWEQHPVPLKKADGGVWTTIVLLQPGKHEYRFLVDGQWQDDPASALRVPNGFGSENCVCVVVEAPARRKSTGKAR